MGRQAVTITLADQVDGSTPLGDERWEHFASQVALGLAVTKAYVSAGYQPDNSNAYKLRDKPEVRTRIQWLQKLQLGKIEINQQTIIAGLGCIAFDKRERTADRINALVALGRAHSLFTDNVNINDFSTLAAEMRAAQQRARSLTTIKDVTPAKEPDAS